MFKTSFRFAITFLFILSACNDKPGDPTAKFDLVELDETFGNDGIVVTQTNSDMKLPTSIELQADGKIVLGTNFLGNPSRISVIRLNDDGSFDPTFNNGPNIGYVGLWNSFVAIQPDGKILSAGRGNISNTNYTSAFALLRLNSDGTSDNSFPNVISTNVGQPGLFSYPNAIVLQPNGKIILGGTAAPASGALSVIALARYNSNGTLDNSFNGNGTVTTLIPPPNGAIGSTASIKSIVLQPDGKILVAGGDSYVTNLLVRYNTNGTLDNTFGNGGIIKGANGVVSSYFNSIALQPDGKPVVAGRGSSVSDGYSVIMRFNTDGTPDLSFNGTGKVVGQFNQKYGSMFNVVKVLGDGKILAAGFIQKAPYDLIEGKLLIARYNSDGTMDMSFNGTGFFTAPINGYQGMINALTMLPDGKILVAGKTTKNNSSQDAFGFVARISIQTPE